MNALAICAVTNLMLAPTLVVAVAVLVKGYADTGDGFAAGAIAALGIVAQYVAHGAGAVREAFPVRWAPGVAVAYEICYEICFHLIERQQIGSLR